MSGKAYTMKEMKVIVDYVSQNKAFGEVKGRKMWVEFANTQLTVRTWQSLKETFLKRILPDIHNPYYKLTPEQIRSFREGCDVAERETNKLEIVNLDDDSNSSNADKQGDIDAPSTSHAKNGDANAGEEVTSSKVQNRDRDSVDTVIIPTCYETAEDIQRDLESPRIKVTNNNSAQTEDKRTTTKSIRDLITYSEPLTPMLQEVLHDFASEDSDSEETRMQIVEEPPPDPKPQTEDNETTSVVPEVTLQSFNAESPHEIQDSDNQIVNEQNREEPIEIIDSEEMLNKNNVVEEKEVQEETTESVPPKVMSLKLKKRKGGYKIDKKKKVAKQESDNKQSDETGKSRDSIESTEDVSVICNTNENDIEKQSTDVLPITNKTTPNLSNSADTILPNNQEALAKPEKKFCTNSEMQDESEMRKSTLDQKIEKGKSKSKTRKRAISQDISTKTSVKNNTLNIGSSAKEKAVSDTDTIKKKLGSDKNIADMVNKAKKAKLSKPEPESSAPVIDSVTEAKAVVDNEASSSKVECNKSTDLSQQNPCLRSVSLFDEQFNKVSYIESESDHEVKPSESKEEKKKSDKDKKESKSKQDTDVHKTKPKGKVVNIMNEVVMLKSHSDSESGNELTPEKNNANDSRVTKSERDKVLANVFGFSSGAVTSKRKRRISHRKNSAYRYPRNVSSGNSSEWTSESDSEVYVSPPRGRKNRQTRKYLKPNSARILSLEEEGGLFVMYGKKIYPLVKDGKIVKNYLTYLPDSDPEEDESYWKAKYVEERQRVEELKKLVQLSHMNNVREKSPILPANPLRNMSIHKPRSPAKSIMNRMCEPDPTTIPVKDNQKEANDGGKTLKITFAKNNQEVHVEGHWSNIHPVLAEVVQLFNVDAEKPRIHDVEQSKPASDASSDKSVAIVPIVDKEVREKVNKLETEIFKEIEKRDQEEVVETKEPPETNVTKRKRAPRAKRSSSNQSSVAQKSSTSSSPRSPKRQKTENPIDIQKEEVEKETAIPEPEKPAEKKPVTEKTPAKKPPKTRMASKKNIPEQKKVDENTVEAVLVESKENSVENVSLEVVSSKSNVRTRRQTKTPKKEEKADATPTSKTRLSRKSNTVAVASPSQVEDDDDIRYMFPPAKKTRTPKTPLGLKTRENKRYTAESPRIYSSPSISHHSESTQGYQDSDVSPPQALSRRKRKLSLTTALSKIRHRTHRNKRKSHPIITDDISSDSNSSYHIVVRPVSVEESLKSDAYKSDSYQFLFPQSKNVFRPLEKIDEDSAVMTEKLIEKGLKTSKIHKACKKGIDINMNNDFVSSSNAVTDGGNSSNVSLPLSPELSIVENLSISKDLLNSLSTNPNLNEIQANRLINNDMNNQYLMSQVDVSMPLMEQDCNFRPSLHSIIKTEYTFNENQPSAVSDSLLNKIDVVNIDNGTSLSESLDTRLRNLLLESAKKMSIGSCDEADINPAKVIQKKSKSGKRCSTPRKKKDVQIKKLNIAEPVVEEEYTESCSYGGRNSCPPAIQVIMEDNIVSNKNVEDVAGNEKGKGRRKKDVIKVKILRPRSKTSKDSQSPNRKVKTTAHNDSGINETVTSHQCSTDSVDLIHNHSETCLHANECLADSVEFIEINTKSIISLNNTESMSTNEMSFKEEIEFKDCEDLAPDLFCQNAQDWTRVKTVQELSRQMTDNASETVFHSPVVSDTSLITEDLSDEPRPSQETKWYLLSEDDTRTVNGVLPSNTATSSFGSNLKQIFPVTCAVPDLSTITEMSGENSRKPTLDSDTSTRHDLDSQSMF